MQRSAAECCDKVEKVARAAELGEQRVSYTIESVAGSDHIAITVRGVINRRVGVQMIVEAHALGKKLGIHKYFMDLTEAVNDDSALDQYEFAYSDLAVTEGIDRLARVAALVNPEDHSHDFIETVCYNAGRNLRLFRSRDEAMAFLGYGDQSNRQRN